MSPGAPQVTNPLPQQLRPDFERLTDGLDQRIPSRRRGRNILVATWNLREFGDLTEKWRSRKGDKALRDLFSLRLIAEVVSRFDVVALQEAQANIKSLRHLIKVLGPAWGFLLIDENRGEEGQGERLAFLYDTRRAKPSGLACELVLPPRVRGQRAVRNDALERQFARTPYAVSFLSSGQTFILVTLHVIYGKRASERTGELRAIARWLRRWADQASDFNQNLIALGDFNIDRQGDPNYEAFTGEGLSPAPEHAGLPRTLPTLRGGKFYDQVAWFTQGGRRKLTLGYEGSGGNFEFDRYVLRRMERVPLSYRISDHYPLWVGFLMPPPG